MPAEPANAVKTRLATLAAMLRLLTADQPFQPILAASVDLTAWQAIFTNECIHLLYDAKRQLPAPAKLKPFEELRDFTDLPPEPQEAPEWAGRPLETSRRTRQ